MSKRDEPHKLIHWPPERARQVRLASGYLGMNNEQFINVAITQALYALAQFDKGLSAALGDIDEA